MPAPCDPLSECKDLDGRLLLQHAVYGPQLAFDPGTASVAGVAARGSALRPLVHLRFEVRWRAVGLCHGLPTSVMGLAPGEVVTVGLRTRSTRTFSSLVREAAERSASTSRTDRQSGPAATGGGIGSLLGGVIGAVGENVAGLGGTIGTFVEKLAAGARRELEESLLDKIELIPKFVGKFGSIFEDAAGAIGGAVAAVGAGAVGAVTGIAGAAGNAVSDLVDNVVGGIAGGGPAAGLTGTLQQISEIIETVERSESQNRCARRRSRRRPRASRRSHASSATRISTARCSSGSSRCSSASRCPRGPSAGSPGLRRSWPNPTNPRPRRQPPAPEAARGAGIAAGGVASAASAAFARPSIGAAIGAASAAGAESGLRGTMLSSVQKATQASGVAKSVRLESGPLVGSDVDARQCGPRSAGLGRHRGPCLGPQGQRDRTAAGRAHTTSAGRARADRAGTDACVSCTSSRGCTSRRCPDRASCRTFRRTSESWCRAGRPTRRCKRQWQRTSSQSRRRSLLRRSTLAAVTHDISRRTDQE